MLRFYTPADRNKSFFKLYKIESVDDYIESISGLDIDVRALKECGSVHSDYAFVEDYLSALIERSPRVCFLGVYDLSKEAYFINKYPSKTFVVGDVSKKALSCLEPYYPNVKVCETTHTNFEAQSDDLIVLNVAEYFLTQEQMTALLAKKGGVILSNVHLYMPDWRWIFCSTIWEARSLALNMLSLLVRRRQWQFRGWWRTVGDFTSAAKGTGKYVKTITFNEKTSRDTRFGKLYRATIHFESKT